LGRWLSDRWEEKEAPLARTGKAPRSWYYRATKPGDYSAPGQGGENTSSLGGLKKKETSHQLENVIYLKRVMKKSNTPRKGTFESIGSSSEGGRRG